MIPRHSKLPGQPGIRSKRSGPTISSPTTTRGKRTREAIVSAARTVFERDGYLAARVGDIAAAAGVSHGSFYTYFSSKEEIFLEVVLALEVMASPHPEHRRGEESEFDAIDRENRRYLAAYRDDARMMAIVEEQSHHHPELAAIRYRRSKEFVERTRRSVERQQRSGKLSAHVDPEAAATALTVMVSKFAYASFVQGADQDFEASVRTLNILWANALGIEHPYD
jgi:AcrR family transcriptional regulator